MLILYLVSALEMLNLAVFFPTFAPYVKSAGGSNTYIGTIMSCASLIGLLWSPIIGSLSDSTGQKSAIRKCLAIGVVGRLLMVIYPSIYTLFLSQLICAFQSAVMGLLRTLINDNLETAEKKASFNSKNGIILALNFMAGAYIAGYITELPNGFYINFCLCAVIMSAEFVLSTFLPENKMLKPKGKDGKKKKSTGGVFGALKTAVTNLKSVNWTKYRSNFVIKANIDVCFIIMQNCIGLVLATKFNAVGRSIGFLYILLSVMGIVTNISMLKMKNLFYKDDVGFKRIQHGAILLAIAFIGFFFSPTLTVFTVFVCLNSIARTLLDNSMNEALAAQTTKEDQGSVFSAFETSMQLAGFTVPFICGLITDTMDERVPFLISVVPCLYAAYVASKQKSKAA